jgi:hypothetical protein
MLRFIRRARDLGFSVAEMIELLGALARPQARQSADVKRIALARIEDLRRKIDEMEQMADTLQTLASCCSGDNRPDCPILADLESPADDDPDRTRRPRGAIGSPLQSPPSDWNRKGDPA